MADCGLCGRDVSSCSCDFGVIENATEEREIEKSCQRKHQEGDACWQASETSHCNRNVEGREE
jgi:hypothetical protein